MIRTSLLAALAMLTACASAGGYTRVRGIVLDSKKGEPLDGVEVHLDFQADAPDSVYRVSEPTKDGGQFSLLVPAQKYSVSLGAPDPHHARPKLELDARPDTTVTLTAQSGTKLHIEQDVGDRLNPARDSKEVVVDWLIHDPQNHPRAEGMNVQLTSSSERGNGFALAFSTDKSGRRRTTIPAGHYDVKVVFPCAAQLFLETVFIAGRELFVQLAPPDVSAHTCN